MIINLLSVYLPAQGSVEDLGTCLDEIAEIVESREADSHCCIMGDCNGDVGNSFGGRGTYPATPQGVLIANFFKRYNLIPCYMLDLTGGPVHTFESHNARSTLDYITIPSRMVGTVAASSVHKDHMLNNSDHFAVSVVINVGQITGTHLSNNQSPCIRWDKMTAVERNTRYTERVDAQVDIIMDTLLASEPNPQNIDLALDALTRSIMNVSMDLPHSAFRKHLEPYWNADLSRLKYLKVTAYREWVPMGRPRGLDNIYYVSYKRAKKEFMKTLVKLSKQYEDEEVLEAVRLAEINRNCFWRLVQKSRKAGGGGGGGGTRLLLDDETALWSTILMMS